MNLTEENIIGVKELNENENISLSDFVPVQKENETEIKKISLEKILLAVSKMTDEQKQVLNSALALIDDENISSEKTFSSEKINSQIETVTTSKVAEIVANAPEDFDTLKEMSDWISEHTEDVSAMNSAILQNKNDIKTLQNASNDFIVCETVNSWNVIKFPKTKTLIAHRFLAIAPPTQSLATSQTYTVSFPYEMSDKNFNFQYSLAVNGTTISKILESDSAGNNKRTTTSTTLYIVYNSSTSKYNITVNVCLIGTYK